MLFLTRAQKVVKYLGSCCMKLCSQGSSKIAQSDHTIWLPKYKPLGWNRSRSSLVEVMKAVSAKAESCCVYVKTTKNYATHACHNFIDD